MTKKNNSQPIVANAGTADRLYPCQNGFEFANAENHSIHWSYPRLQLPAAASDSPGPRLLRWA